MAKDCPACGLVNPPGAQRCDCGFDFGTRRMKRSYLEPKQVGYAAKAAAIGVGGVFAAFLIMRLIARLVFDLHR